MPKAAWCSACQRYVWVAEDGRCQNGHDAVFLTAYYESAAPGPPAETPAAAPGGVRAPVVPAAFPADAFAPTSPAPPAPPAPPAAPMPAATTASRPERRVPAAYRDEAEGPVPQHHARAFVWIPVAALVVLVAAGVAVGAVVASRPARHAVRHTASADTESANGGVPPFDRSSITSDALAPSDDAAVEPPEAPKPPRLTTDATVPSPVLDAFIAEQYPGYRVLKRVSFPNQYDEGRLGENYLLQSKSEPRFRLLVSVALLKQSESLQDADTAYDFQVGRVLSTDGTFSLQAKKDYSDLQKKGQAAIIHAIVAHLPSSDGIVVGGLRDSTIDFDVESGTGALERAMQDEGDSDGSSTVFEVSPPIYADNSHVDVTVERD